MARLFTPAAEYRLLRDEVERACVEIVDRYDPTALVYVNVTAMGLIHVIVVSDRLTLDWKDGPDDRLWELLEERLSPEAVASISLLQVLSEKDALRLNGPLDAERLAKLGDELAAQWDALDGTEEQGLLRFPDSLEVLAEETRNWARTCSLVLCQPEVRELNHSLSTAEQLAQNLSNDLPVLNTMSANIRRIVRSLLHLVPSQEAA